MIGRVVRILSLNSPPNIEEFKIDIIDYNSSLFVSEITIDRESFESNELKFDGPKNLWNSVSVNNSKKAFYNNNSKNNERLSWSLYPYLDFMLFDPNAPIRYHIGAELKGSYQFLPVTSINGSLKQPIAGTMDDIKRGPKGRLQMFGLISCITTETLALICISVSH